MNTFNFNKRSPIEINKLIAARVRDIRKRKKISQEKLSEKSGVSLGSVKRFEGSGEISLISLTKIAIVVKKVIYTKNNNSYRRTKVIRMLNVIYYFDFERMR